MRHPIHKVRDVEVVGTYEIIVRFDDGTSREIDLEPVLEGKIYRPLKDPAVFEQVAVDPEVHTIVWPNGADFDPAILHDWPEHAEAMREMAQKWAMARAS